MKIVSLIIVSMLMTACANNPPIKSEALTVSETIRVPYEKAWQKTLQVLKSQGFSIDSSNKTGGVISIGETIVKLNERQADCGNFHGISFLKDYRTSTSVTLFIDLEKISENATAIRVNSSLKAAFHNGIGSDTTYLSCYSSGDFEKRLIASIKE